MSDVACRDIFNGVYINVKGSYIANLYSSKTKSTTYLKTINEDENLEKQEKTDPVSLVNINARVSNTTLNETVSETVDRQDESEVLAKIRLDIDEKFPYIIASFCSNTATLDRAYRKLNGFLEQPAFSEYILEQDQIFPLSERFVYPCIMYISSMVLIDIDEKMSDLFYDKYVSLISSITKEIPLECLSTVEKYPY